MNDIKRNLARLCPLSLAKNFILSHLFGPRFTPIVRKRIPLPRNQLLHIGKYNLKSIKRVAEPFQRVALLFL